MQALILAVGLLTGATQGRFSVTATVVRTVCIDIDEAGEARLVRNRLPGSSSVHCMLESDPSAAPPRVVTSTGIVHGRAVPMVEINH